MAGVEVLVAYAFFDYSSDEEDYYDLLPVNTLLRRENVPRINLYVENVVGAMSDRDFASHFRLNRSCIRSIETMIMTDTLFHCIGGCVWKQLLMTLWILATPDSYRSVADRFDVSKSTLWLAFKETVSAVARLSPTIIRFPTVADMAESEVRFRGMSSFPGVIGCIDGTHIEIKAPQTMPESYVNRNSFYSVILQGVANSRMEFIHCYAGEVGSVHDARVYRKSKIGQQITTLMPGNYHFLGDGAYPLQLNLITPFKNNGHLTRRQLNFNRKLSATRCVIERAFGQLKGRFRRLKYLDMNRTDFIPSVIMACCVLHNLGLRQAIDDITIDVEDVNDDDSSDDSGNLQNLQSFAAVAKRDSIMNSL